MDYKLFIFERARVFSAMVIAAENDEAALVNAEALRAGRDAELWDQTRRVFYWRSYQGPEAAPPPTSGRTRP